VRRVAGLLAAVLAAVVAAACASPAGPSPSPAAPSAGPPGPTTTWHRVNGFGLDVGQHERLVCIGGDVWRCTYDKLPEEQLGLDWDDTTGVFLGSERVLEEAGCPQWAGRVCASAERIVVGSTTYSGAGKGSWWQELIFTDADGVAPMYQYIAGPGLGEGVVCPWYQSFEQAQDDPGCISPEA
jgi:hypothetical protein